MPVGSLGAVLQDQPDVIPNPDQLRFIVHRCDVLTKKEDVTETTTVTITQGVAGLCPSRDQKPRCTRDRKIHAACKNEFRRYHRSHS